MLKMRHTQGLIIALSLIGVGCTDIDINATNHKAPIEIHRVFKDFYEEHKDNLVNLTSKQNNIFIDRLARIYLDAYLLSQNSYIVDRGRIIVNVDDLDEED